jgi:hypothetical protein
MYRRRRWFFKFSWWLVMEIQILLASMNTHTNFEDFDGEKFKKIISGVRYYFSKSQAEKK